MIVCINQFVFFLLKHFFFILFYLGAWAELKAPMKAKIIHRCFITKTLCART